MLPFTARLLFYNSLVLPVFDYGDLAWGNKNHVTLMNDLQVLQKKAANIILERPLYSSATDALGNLKWLNLEQRRFYHRCIYIYKCINGLMDHPMNLLTNSDIHNYNTRNKDMLRLPRVTRNRPFAVYDHMVQKPPCWRANYPLGHPKQKNIKLSCFVLDVPVGSLLSIMAVFVPCDRKLQRAYCISIISIPCLYLKIKIRIAWEETGITI